MKVCHMTSVHPVYDVRIFEKECVSLTEKYNVVLLAPCKESHSKDGVKIVDIPLPDNNRLKRFLLSNNIVYKKALAIDADIYHFHDPELIPVAKRLKRKGKKVIYDAHEDVPRQIMYKKWIPKFLRKTVSILYEISENRAARTFDAIVTATPYLRERFQKSGCKNVVDVCNYPIVNFFDETPSSDERKINNKGNNICYVGGISKERGIFEMVNAIENLDVKLLLAGKFHDLNERDLVKKITAWDKVVELGYLDRNEIKLVLHKSQIGLVVLHPTGNHVNSYPVKMFEYLAAGIPVIASNFPLWKEIIEKNECGICVDPYNVKEIEDAIHYLMINQNKARKMGENGRKVVSEKYNWNNEKNKLINLYEKLE